MTDELTEVLRTGTEHLPAALRRPADLRRNAEHRRRVRRVIGGTVLGAACLAVAIGWNLGGQAAPTPRPAPAVTPTTPRPAPAVTPTTPSPSGAAVFSTAAHPLLTEAQWRDIAGPGTRTAVDPHRIHSCTPDPRGHGEPTESSAGTYRERERPGTQINEYVMRYADETEAIQAFADVYTAFAGCRDPAYDENNPIQGSLPQGIGYLAEEAFVAEQGLKSAKGPDFGPGPFAYQLIAGRDGNVVIVIESTGWGERSFYTMQGAFMQAIPAERGKCAPVCQ